MAFSINPASFRCGLVLLLLLGGCFSTDSFSTGTSSTGKESRYEVATSSMAPALLGKTRLASCSQCGQQSPIAVETYNAALPTRCRSCGGVCQVSSAIQAGQQVALLPIPIRDTPAVRRFDLVAINVQPATPPQVKRIWGLPGEQLEIRAGELWIDGRMLQKSLTQMKEVCVPVASFPKDRNCFWWLDTADAESPLDIHRDSIPTGAAVTLAAGQTLCWRYARPAPVHPHEVPKHQWLEPGPIVDDYAENQGLRRQLHVVDDYLLRLVLQRPLTGELRVDCKYLGRTLTVFVQASDQPRWPQGAPASPLSLVIPCVKRLEVGFCDRRILLETDVESRSVDWEYVSPATPLHGAGDDFENATEIIRIASSSKVGIQQLTVARDLYLLTPEGLGEVGVIGDESQVGSDGYFVLGDNLPVSIDSRGPLGRVSATQLLGSVKKIGDYDTSRFSVHH